MSVNPMQTQSKSLIFTDPTVEIATCRNRCIVRRLNKLPLIAAVADREKKKTYDRGSEKAPRKTSCEDESTHPDSTAALLERSSDHQRTKILPRLSGSTTGNDTARTTPSTENSAMAAAMTADTDLVVVVRSFRDRREGEREGLTESAVKRMLSERELLCDYE